jgi:riboflavin biosynthesis pyrimidine reductase
MQYSDEALLEHYALRDRSRRWVRANFIASLDGAATHEGHTRGLNNADDKRVFDGMAALARSPVRPIIFTLERSAPEKRQALSAVADVVPCGRDTLDCRAMLAALAERGLVQVLCEGGPHLFAALIEADCIDELCLTLSPVLENGSAGRIVAGAAQTTRSMRLGHAISVGSMLMVRYERDRTRTRTGQFT